MPEPATAIEVRPLTPADAEAYTRLRREMLLDSPWAFAASPETDVALDAAYLAGELARPAGFAIVGVFARDTAAADPRLVAAATLMGTRHAKIAHRAAIFGVYVTPSMRGRGVGEALMRGVFDAAHAWPGVTTLSLSVSVRSQAALRLYERMGFRRWGLEPGALILDGDAVDEIHMSATLAR